MDIYLYMDFSFIHAKLKDEDQGTKVIIQSVDCIFKLSSEKENIVSTIEKCAKDGIDIITIGIKNADANNRYLIKEDEVRLFSNNKKYSILCDYESMLEHLKRIAAETGGPMDYWWEALHTSDWHKKL